MTKYLDDLPVPSSEDSVLYDLIFGRHALPVIALAQEMRLFEYLSDQPRDLDEIAETLRVAPRAAEALVAVSASLSFLERGADGCFQTTALSRTYLLPESPFYYGPILSSDDPSLDQLRRSVRDGDGPVQPFAVEMNSLSPEEVRGFLSRMHARSLPAASALAEQEIFRRIGTVLDVGAGSGALACAIAKKNPGIRCTAMDLDPVCAIARENVEAFGLETRVEVIAANMFEDPWPKGHDAILFGNIFHDWDAESCARLATRSFQALESGGCILLHEVPIKETKDGPPLAAYFSVAMLLHEKGKQYSLSELEKILMEAGFIDFNSTPTFGYYQLISASKP
jgi:acetylserotonin N-methyltransferase